MAEVMRPQPGPQTQFLSSPADIVIFGGAAGGGKTWSLLVEPLRHIDNPKFGAVIFRRTIPEITKEGGMWDESGTLYPLFQATSNENDHQWKFPGGARVTFAHLQYEKDLSAWRGAQIPLIELDQLETFTANQFFYMLSRNRSTCGVRPYVRASANPEPGWLADFIDWWIAADGYADLERVGLVRWFVRQSEGLVWADTCAALQARYPNELPLSVTFILSTIYDNQILLQKDPGYLARLKNLNLVDRERLLGDKRRGGNWKIKPAAGKIFNRAWFEIVDAAPAGGQECSFWDFAATKKTLVKPDPDFTARVRLRKVDGIYYVLHCLAEQVGPAESERLFVQRSRQDAEAARREGAQFAVRWEIEPGSAGLREAARFAQLLDGLNALGIAPQGDKISRAKPLAAQAQAGNVKVVRGAWNEMFLEHMHHQPEWPHDDIMDASSGAHNYLSGGQLEGSLVV